jgi:hypothetical protein
MEIGDIQFRIGLIIAVLVLGSAFAGGLYLLIGENDEGDAKRTADTLGRALEALSPGSSSASLVIEFRSGEGEGILPVSIMDGKEYYIINLLKDREIQAHDFRIKRFPLQKSDTNSYRKTSG